ncbi:hypothetical protein AB0F92_42175 [Kitasatospora aureofaciens]|uniref:hypothetical protein n=1 Tax=Kitasatospora aureofaciens TaxID=1894 RepID=UPI0033FF903F
MTGIVEIAVGWLAAWATRKVRRVVGRADAEFDHATDTAMDHLHEVIGRKLGQDRALAKVDEEVEAGTEELTPSTRQWLQLALQDAIDNDPEFAKLLQEAVGRLQAEEDEPGNADGTTLSGNTFSGPTAIQTGAHGTQTNTFR